MFSARALATKIAIFVLVVDFLVFLSLAAQVNAAPGTMSLDENSGPVGTVVTITGAGWNDYIPTDLSPELYLSLIWVDHQPQLNTRIDNWLNQPGFYKIVDFQVDNNGNFVLKPTIQSSWKGTGYFGIALENPSTGYLYAIFTAAGFKVTTSGGPGGASSGQPLNSDVATFTGVLATGTAVVLVAGQRIRLSRKKDFRSGQKVERETDQSTGISYEKPPETFVKQLDPPGGNPEKTLTRGEVLRDWTLTPDYVKQAWRNYDACKESALDWIADIREFNKEIDLKKRIQINNLLKACTKLAFQTTGVIEDGISSAFIEKLRAASETTRLAGDLSRARMFGESLAEIEKYRNLVARAKQDLQAATQSAATLKEMLGDWSRRMEIPAQADKLAAAGDVDGARTLWISGKGTAGDAVVEILGRVESLDPATKRYLTGNNDAWKAISRNLSLGDGSTSVEELFKQALSSATSVAMNNIKYAQTELEAEQSMLQMAITKANTILEYSAGALAKLTGWIDKVFGKPAELGGLDMDDPAILAQGQGDLENLQNQLNWAQKNYQMAVDCMNENKKIIDGYDEIQASQDNMSGENNADEVLTE